MNIFTCEYFKPPPPLLHCLQEIPASLGKLQQLKTLDLAKNRIQVGVALILTDIHQCKQKWQKQAGCQPAPAFTRLHTAPLPAHPPTTPRRQSRPQCCQTAVNSPNHTHLPTHLHTHPNTLRRQSRPQCCQTAPTRTRSHTLPSPIHPPTPTLYAGGAALGAIRLRQPPDALPPRQPNHDAGAPAAPAMPELGLLGLLSLLALSWTCCGCTGRGQGGLVAGLHCEHP